MFPKMAAETVQLVLKFSYSNSVLVFFKPLVIDCFVYYRQAASGVSCDYGIKVVFRSWKLGPPSGPIDIKDGHP